MTFAVALFCVLFVLSAEGKPALKEDGTCGYDACPQVSSDTLNIHLVPHSHDDVGWLKTPDQYYFQDVQNVISSVVDALNQNPNRTFVQVETAFFKKWWVQQNDYIKSVVQQLVDNGQFEFINAAWSMNDEAAVHYQSTIDQFTLGLRYIQDNFGTCARPKVSWQIDPFGHSREQASITAQMGFDSFFFARLDYRDKDRRSNEKQLDLLWQGSANLQDTDVFTSVLYRHYSAPPNFCWDIVCNDEVIIDDEESPDFNLESRVQEFADYVKEMADHYPTNNLLVTMGDDFRYTAAMTTYMNIDRLINGFERYEQTYNDKRIKVYYSSPSCYTKAVNDYVNANNINLQLKTDDFFPYADGSNTYWTGYFTSRPASKHFERQGNNLAQVAKQLAANTQEKHDNEGINTLKEAVGVMQHHDAITGTEKQHVAQNYHFLMSRGINSATEEASRMLSNLISGNDEDFQLNSCLLANVSACAPAESDSFTAVIYNPLSHTVTTPVSLPAFDRTSWSITDPDGNAVAYQIIDSLMDFSYVEEATTSKNTVEFVATDVPPLGYKTYEFQASSKNHKPNKPKPRLTVGYDDTSFDIDESSGLLKSVTMNGVTIDITQDFQYYTSQDSSGAYIFVPDGQDTTRIASDSVTTTAISGDVYEGVIQEFAPWAKQIIKVYNDDRSFIEFDWIIGPIDISEGNGKEVITKYTTALASDSTFYTDSNGREWLKRVRNSRPDYDYSDEQPTSGNYYPVNNKISIKDESQDIELAIITDRSEGGSSIKDGEIELMVHRACHHDDGRGVGENLNEQEYGAGIRVRGKHYLILGKGSGDGEKSIKAIERQVAQRKTVQPWIFVTDNDVSSSLNIKGYSFLKQELPENVHLLSLEPWDDNTLLLRLEHYLEQGEDDNLSKAVTVDLSELFDKFSITELQEMTLGANVPLAESQRLSWPGTSKQQKEIRDVDDLTVNLAPMQIRTFLAKVTYV